MAHTEARAWWADVEHLQGVYARTDEARRRADRADDVARHASRERQPVEAEAVRPATPAPPRRASEGHRDPGPPDGRDPRPYRARARRPAQRRDRAPPPAAPAGRARRRAPRPGRDVGDADGDRPDPRRRRHRRRVGSRHWAARRAPETLGADHRQRRPDHRPSTSADQRRWPAVPLDVAATPFGAAGRVCRRRRHPGSARRSWTTHDPPAASPSARPDAAAHPRGVRGTDRASGPRALFATSTYA